MRKSTLRLLPFRPVAASSNKQHSSKAWPQLHSSLSGKVIGTRGGRGLSAKETCDQSHLSGSQSDTKTHSTGGDNVAAK